MKHSFRDRHDRIDYLKVCEIAHRITTDPALIEDARPWVEDVMAADPHQQRYVVMWRESLTISAAEIAQALIEHSERGQLLRETRPIFGKGLTSQNVSRLMVQAGP